MYRRSSSGTPRMRAKTVIGISELIASTKSNSCCGSASSRTIFVTARTCSSQTPMARGVKRRLTIPRSSSWRGGSMSIIDLRASTCSGSRSSSEVPPISDENRAGSRCTSRMSS